MGGWEIGYTQAILGQKKGGNPHKNFTWGKVNLVMFLDIGLLSLNPIFSAPHGQNFSAHQKEEDQRISKITLLLFLVPFLKELWPLKQGNKGKPWDTLYLYFKDTKVKQLELSHRKISRNV